ncbi:ATPase [Niastella yeongjuensis]|uniref:ATPase n=1 Tax=Niastella yeongjuensis TaxID=354355 RepID=A0A1V9EPD6_9BACT|nr:SRPBCC domain-containing protein [Niastella yeongjuensis]OQP48023.1 ATPase [Niastella yeongjuensis]SEO23900.1 Activator of Hsp90 ATPase homolog 1-like protein [Niastella yeongjuensis]
MANDFNSSFSAPISASEAIKKISNITGWWGVNLTGNSEKQNDTFQITMGNDAFFDCTVTELVPGKRVVWSVSDCFMPWFTNKKEWSNTRLIFDLHENNGNTELQFTHEGLTPDIECYKDCEQGWTHWIKTSLQAYLTTGQGVFRKPTK